MRAGRFALVAVLAVAIAALTMWWHGSDADPDDSLATRPVPAGAPADNASSTWFCAASSAATERAPNHTLVLSNTAGEPGQATLTGFNDEGPTTSRTVEFAGAAPTIVAMETILGASDVSVMVESETASLVVEHRLAHADGASQVPCSNHSSDSWLFPVQTTLRGTSARLVLFNPFSKDATVDISAAVDDGVRSPPAWTGVVVPAGTRRTVELGEHADRRDIFSVAVTARTGRLVAETVQWFDRDAEGDTPAMHGLHLQLGVPRGSADHLFPAGFAGSGVLERFVVYNPGDEATSALVQVIPYGSGELVPEPFELEIGARRFATIDLSAESRIPPTGFHTVTISTTDGAPVVAAVAITIDGPPTETSTADVAQRPDLDEGATATSGTPVLARRWWTTGVPVGPSFPSSVLVHNPGAGVVKVDATVVGGEHDGHVLADSVEIAGGDSLVLQTTTITEDSNVSILIESDGAVAVDRLITFTGQNDLSLGLGVPLYDPSAPLTPYGES